MILWWNVATRGQSNLGKWILVKRSALFPLAEDHRARVVDGKNERVCSRG
jgi:hypothetical protein